MRRLSFLIVGVSLIACGSGTNDDPTVSPDPTTSTSGSGGASTTTGAGGASSTTGVGGSSHGGNGGGGGNGTEQQKQGYVSGTRLRARYLEGSDGSRYYNGFQDTMLGVPCFPQRASDGITRCLPQEPQNAVGSFFSDSNCTNPAIVVLKSCASPPTYGRRNAAGGSTCEYAVEIIQRVGAITTLYSGEPGSCSATTVFDATHDFYSATVVAPSTFQAMTPMVE